MSKNQDYEDRHRTFRVASYGIVGGDVILSLKDTGETGRSYIAHFPKSEVDEFLARNRIHYRNLNGSSVVANVRKERNSSSTKVTGLVGMASQPAL